MSFWRRVILVATVFAVVMVAGLPVLAQGGALEDDLTEELGGNLWRGWCRETTRIAALDLADEVGCMLWRCWCRTQTG